MRWPRAPRPGVPHCSTRPELERRGAGLTSRYPLRPDFVAHHAEIDRWTASGERSH